jgi:hypothetical protein
MRQKLAICTSITNNTQIQVNIYRKRRGTTGLARAEDEALQRQDQHYLQPFPDPQRHSAATFDYRWATARL